DAAIRSMDQRGVRSARRGEPPPASAPTASAMRMVLRNIFRGQPGRGHWLRGHVSCRGLMEHARQLVLAIRRAFQDLAVEADQDGHDLGVELDAAELLELLDRRLVAQR